MPKTLMKSRIFSNKNNIRIKLELNIFKSTLPPNLQSFTQKLLSGDGFLVYIWALKILNYWIMKQVMIQL